MEPGLGLLGCGLLKAKKTMPSGIAAAPSLALALLLLSAAVLVAVVAVVVRV